MSLNGVIDEELAERLAGLSTEDFAAIARAGSLGLSPTQLRAGVQTILNGDVSDLPSGGGQPKPLIVQAWSFARDKGQYHDTYGLSSAQAGELTDLLRANAEEAVKKITEIVTTHLRTKGSNRPVQVNLAGLPSSTHAPQAVNGGRTGRGVLKDEIRQDPAFFGLFQSFVVEDTGRTGSERFRVRLGGGLYATHPSKQGAIDTARVCRKHGRHHDLVAGSVAFWLEGKPPQYGDSIPAKVTFDGKLPPNGNVPADPVVKDKTVAQPADGSTPPQRSKSASPDNE